MSKAGSVTFTSGWDTEALDDPLDSQIFGDALDSQVLEGEALGDASASPVPEGEILGDSSGFQIPRDCSHCHKDLAMERALAPSPSVDLRDKGLQHCHVVCGSVCYMYLPALENCRVGIGVL